MFISPQTKSLFQIPLSLATAPTADATIMATTSLPQSQNNFNPLIGYLSFGKVLF
jgi:hypothetical protein